MTQLRGQPQPTTARARFVGRLLDPMDRLVEAIYSVLIVLTFTLAIDVLDTSTAVGESLVSAAMFQLFVAAFGCAVAWGLIDGVMYVMTSMFERGEERRLFMAIGDAASEEEGVALLADELDGAYAEMVSAEDREVLYRGLYARLKAAAPRRVGFKKEDFAGALGVALVAVLAALPVVLPLLLAPVDPTMALRLSNVVAFGMLYWMGQRWGRRVGAVPWKMGLSLLLIGVAMMVVAIPLGG
jgi:hypothetical protein